MGVPEVVFIARKKPVIVPIVEIVEKIIDVPVVKQVEIPQVLTVERVVEIPSIETIERIETVPRIQVCKESQDMLMFQQDIGMCWKERLCKQLKMAQLCHLKDSNR